MPVDTRSVLPAYAPPELRRVLIEGRILRRKGPVVEITYRGKHYWLNARLVTAHRGHLEMPDWLANELTKDPAGRYAQYYVQQVPDANA